MTKIIKTSNRTEWLQQRTMGIGSSEVGTILGLNPFETPYQLWRRKKGMDAPKEENFAMRAGHYLEDAVSLFYRDATGVEIIKSSKGDWLAVDDERPYLRVSPDRTFWLPNHVHNNHNKGILECKTTQLAVDEDDIPKHWFCQLQYQLGVMGYEAGALAWLTQGREFGYKNIDFDPDFYAFETEKIQEYWERYIIGDEEPVATDVSDVLIKFPHHVDGKVVVADNGLIDAIAELKAIKMASKERDAKKKSLEDEIKMALGDAESLESPDGQTLATWRSAKDSIKFDEKAFKTAEPDLYAKYVKPVPGTRRFLIK
jgi:putative phage-type endonuclease